MVHHKTGTLDGTQLHRGGAAGSVHDTVGHAFHILTLPSSWILMLVVGFTLPGGDDRTPKNVEDFVADLNLSAVTDEFCGSTMVVDDVLQCVHELLLHFHAKNIGHKGCFTNKELGHFVAAINGGNIRIDSVGGKGLAACLLYTSPSPRD